jgi:hypothetical protein
MAQSNESFPSGDEFVFDPFGLYSAPGAQEDNSSTASPQPPPQVNRLTRSTERQPPGLDDSTETSKSVALPPRLVVKFVCHEEVSSVAETGPDNEGASEVHIEGKLSVSMRYRFLSVHSSSYLFADILLVTSRRK